jgi:hypothetical protein
MKTTKELLAAAADRLKNISASGTPGKVLTGFDGFVDNILKAVREKKGSGIKSYATITDFSDRLRLAAGKSAQIEWVTQRKMGGNAPILASALGQLDIDCTCSGSLGYPQMNNVFKILAENCNVISLLNPGISNAVEFDDGKIILSELDVFDIYDWNYIRRSKEYPKIEQEVKASDVIAFVDWANLPHSSDIWEGILDYIIKKSGRRDYVFLFDLCDPSRRTAEEIDELLDLISSFSFYGKVTLGLNENETLALYAALNGIDYKVAASQSKIPAVEEAGMFIHNAMNIDYLLVHPRDRALLFHEKHIIQLTGRVITEPKLVTGAGDNFNAGYLLARLHKLDDIQSLILAMTASGAYVQNGHSPTVMEMIDFISNWSDELSTRGNEEKRVNEVA